MQSPPSVLIVEARYYEDIAASLVQGAVTALDTAGCDYERLSVPGVFEVPAAIRMALRAMREYSWKKPYAGFVALGCVIRGETSHYDYVCSEASRALMDLTTEFGLALGFGILTCENMQQAMVRADVSQVNKGGEAAKACLRMMELNKHFNLN